MENIEKGDLKSFIEELKRQWRLMWRERVDDKLRAEGIAAKDYQNLFVERGLVIVATKDFRSLNFADIVQQHVPEADRWVPPCPSVGGWGKFIREVLRKQIISRSSRRRQFAPEQTDKSKCGPPKKGGRGWLHK